MSFLTKIQIDNTIFTEKALNKQMSLQLYYV